MLAAPDVRRRPLLGVAGAVAIAVLTVSGCSAGQNAQTVEQTSVVDGTAFQAGQVNLRDVGLRAPGGPSYAAGDNAYLEGLMVNNAAAADTLVSVTTPAAGSVAFYTDGVTALLGTAPTAGAGTSTAPSGSPTDFGTPTTNTGAPSQAGTPSSAQTPSGSGSPTDTASPSGTGSASSSPSTSAAAAAAPLTDLPLPNDQSIQFGYGNGQVALVLLDLKTALFPAETFPITFTFANGGAVTVEIAVKLPVDSTLDAPTINTEEGAGGE